MSVGASALALSVLPGVWLRDGVEGWQPAGGAQPQWREVRVGEAVHMVEPGSRVAGPPWESTSQLGMRFPLGQGRRPQAGHPGCWASPMAPWDLHPPIGSRIAGVAGTGNSVPPCPCL